MDGWQLDTLWLACLLVSAPFGSALAVYIYMRLRYRKGIAMQEHFDRDLQKDT